eukprot:410872-Prorocentrum_lima.AAC.1
MEHHDIGDNGHHLVIKSSLDLDEINGKLATILKGVTPRPLIYPGQAPIHPATLPPNPSTTVR